jgi:peptidoglycan/LPS O-acetylase OafA/YrhL
MASAPTENPVSDFKFDALTSLRGIAALCTVLAHLIVIWGEVFPALREQSLFRDFALHTYLFVDFFFVLSGFVMSHAYGRHFAHAVGVGSYLRFLRARFARVYPLHLLLLLVYVGLAAIGLKQTQENPDWSIAAHLVLLHAMGFFSHTTWNQPSWSISVEWWTYIVFPFAVPLARRYVSKTVAACALPVILGLFAFLAMHFGSANLTVGFAFFRCLIGFSAGACLYAVVRYWRTTSFARPAANGALVAIFLVLLFVPSPYADMLAFVCFCALVYAASMGHGGGHWLHHPVLIWIGDISYSIYLWHSLLLQAFAKALGAAGRALPFAHEHQVLFFLAGLVVFEIALLVLAHMSYRLIELPLRTFLGPKKTGTQRVESSGAAQEKEWVPHQV